MRAGLYETARRSLTGSHESQLLAKFGIYTAQIERALEKRNLNQQMYRKKSVRGGQEKITVNSSPTADRASVQIHAPLPALPIV